MHLIANAFISLLGLILIAQGVQCIRQDHSLEYVRWFGILTISLAVIGAVCHILLLSRMLVLSSEFGLVMVQGPFGRFCAYLVITVIAISAAIGWHVARLATKRNSSTTLMIILGIAAALLSVIPPDTIAPLNALEAPAHQIYRYDIWWPPMLIWGSLCAVEILLMACNLYSSTQRLWLAAAWITVLAYYALREPLPFLPRSTVFWKFCLGISLPLSMSVATWIGSQPRADRPTQGRWKQIVLTAFSAIVGLFSILLAILFLKVFLLPWLVWGSWLTLLGIAGAYRLYRRLNARSDGKPYPSEISGKYHLPFIIFLTIPLFLPFLVRFANSNPVIASTFFTLGWIVLAEAILPGKLGPLSQWTIVDQIRQAQSPLKHSLVVLRDRLKSGVDLVGNRLKAIFSAEKWPVAVLKVLIGLIVLIILNEIPNFGKTVIQPFSVVVKETSDRLGQVVSAQILNGLSSYQKDLQPDDVQLESDKIFKYVSPGEIVTSAYAKSADFDIGGVKIPLEVLAAPIQSPLRRLLGVRVISGKLYADEEKRYSLLANSSGGTTWKTALDLKTENIEPVTYLSEKLAFQIMQADRTSLSLPTSWETFDVFRQGLESWRAFQNNQDYSALKDAILKFQEVTLKDRMFALAHYRLGLALLADGRPGAAAEAFRASLEADPTLVASRLALANTLLYFDSYYVYPAASPKPFFEEKVRNRRRQEARNLLQQVVDSNSVFYLPSAYYGLCRIASEGQDSQLAYYYCQQATVLYERLASRQGSGQRTKTDEAIVLNEIGVILDNSRSKSIESDDPNWHCSAYNIDENHLTEDGKIGRRLLRKGPYTSSARTYFERARDLSPDDSVIRCNLASAEHVLGDKSYMKALESDAKVSLNLADNYRELAKEKTFSNGEKDHLLAHAYYRLALNEFQRSMSGTISDISRERLDAFNGFAYTFWVWQLNLPDDCIKHLKPREAEFAEAYAREAISLANEKPNYIKAMMKSTLGEVLIALKRPHEAYEILEEAENLAPKNPLFNEIRWDLAQAYNCASIYEEKANPLSNSWKGLAKKASVIFKEIRAGEETLETRPFEENYGLLDPAFHRKVCEADFGPRSSIEAIARKKEAMYKLDGDPLYGEYRHCHWMGIYGQSNDGEKNLILHVWGKGINGRTYLDGQAPITLDFEPRESHRYFFAQLENENYEPLSKIYPIATESSCDRNMITLIFDKATNESWDQSLNSE